MNIFFFFSVSTVSVKHVLWKPYILNKTVYKGDSNLSASNGTFGTKRSSWWCKLPFLKPGTRSWQRSKQFSEKNIRVLCESEPLLWICERTSIALFLTFQVSLYVNYTKRNKSLFRHVTLLLSSKHSFLKVSEII